MKTALLMTALLMGSAMTVHAAETVGEKATATGHDAKRAAKKGANRVKEAVCMEGDVKCAAKKAGNRVEEAKDATVDGAKKAKESVD